MNNVEKQERLDQLLIVAEELASKGESVPNGLQMNITKLKQDLGLIQCDLDGDCLNCGS